MGTSGRLRTQFYGAFGFGGPTIEEVAHLFAATPELAQSVTKLKLRGSSISLSIKEGASLIDILRACFNVEDLHFKLTRPALDALAASRIRLDRLHTLRMECWEPELDSIARLLAKMPNVRALSLSNSGLAELRKEDDMPTVAHGAALLPHLVSYSQTAFDDPYFTSILAAGKTSLRALTLFTRRTLPELSHLTALTRLHVKITGRGPTPLDAGFHSGLVRCSRLRHLDVTCADLAHQSLFAAVAALGSRLSTLKIHVAGSRSAAGQELAAQLVPLVRGPLTRLRDLRVWVEFIDDDGMSLLREEVGSACRARRVRFVLKNYCYE